MPGILNSEVTDLKNPLPLNDNDKTIRDALRNIYSRGSFAVNSMTMTGNAGGSQDPRYGDYFFNLSGLSTAFSLLPANYWGVNKAPLIILKIVGLSGGASLSIAPNGTDTINNAAGSYTSTLVGNTIIMYSDGVSNWTLLDMGSGSWIGWTATIDQANAQFIPTSSHASLSGLAAANRVSTTSASFVTAVNYTGSGVLTFCYAFNDTANAFPVSVRITIDGTVVYNAGATTAAAHAGTVLVGASMAVDGAAQVAQPTESPIGIPFASSCLIEVHSDGTAGHTATVGWKIQKRT